MVLQHGLSKGYESTSEFSDSEVDEILTNYKDAELKEVRKKHAEAVRLLEKQKEECLECGILVDKYELYISGGICENCNPTKIESYNCVNDKNTTR